MDHEKQSFGFQFSSDELRVLRECNKESFFQRSVPLSSAFGFAAYFCVKNGFLKANPKFGSVPKVIVGVIIGYFAGKFSYQQKCAEKLMRLPNSRLAEILRNRQGGVAFIEPNTEFQSNSSLEMRPSNSPNEFAEGQLSTNWEDNESLFPTYGSHADTPDNRMDLVKEGNSYEEIRRRNREKYLKLNENQRINVPFNTFGHVEQNRTSEASNENDNRWSN